ncbi:MAG: hypothetical protein KC434_06835 [Anaerolineales bacterium]|nr:hypothetical protein [Anaerolineales bacterium]
MSKRIVSVKKEDEKEKQVREWLAGQELKSVDNLEAAARQLISLVTALFGILFGVLTVSSDPLPIYFTYPTLRILGVISIILLLLTLIGALVVIIPIPQRNYAQQPDEQTQLVKNLISRKMWGLYSAAILFGGALILLGIILVSALLIVS